MHNKDKLTEHYTDDHGDGVRGIGLSPRADTAIPPTMLVTELDNGALVVQGRPDGPRVYLSPGEAVALRQELAITFGSPKQGTSW